MSGRAIPPRVVVVTRPSDYERLLWRHGTREQARFFLESREQSMAEVERRHAAFEGALAGVLAAIPVSWRRSRVGRGDLSRFVFEERDIIVAVGQDGLVPNIAKYLVGQPVIGINPDPHQFDGVLLRHAEEKTADLLVDVDADRAHIEDRSMVEARFDDGQRLWALNEIFLGHRTHQSALYRIRFQQSEERQSSSGVIVSTGTGSTGWALSIHRERAPNLLLPDPEDRTLVFFVREAFPSVSTETGITAGTIEEGQSLSIVSEMNDGGALFGDGIEEDRIDFGWGLGVEIGLAAKKLRLVV